jgi:hypothetical protein
LEDDGPNYMVFQQERVPLKFYTAVWEFFEWLSIEIEWQMRSYHLASSFPCSYTILLGYYPYKTKLLHSTTVQHFAWAWRLDTTCYSCSPNCHVYKCVELNWLQIALMPGYSECSDWTSVNCQAHITTMWSHNLPKLHFRFCVSYALSNITFKLSTFNVFTLH